MRVAIESYLKGLSDAVKKEQQEKRIIASGASANSLKVVANDTGGALWGAGYFVFQNEGRAPGKFPPIEEIMQWIIDKRIQPDIPIKSLAFLIARKIAKMGTNIFQDKNKGLQLNEIVKTGLPELTKEIAKDGALRILTSLS